MKKLQGLQSQLLGITMLPATLLLTLCAAIFADSQCRQLDHALVNAGEAHISQLASAVHLANAQHDTLGIEKILKSALSEPMVVRSALVRQDGTFEKIFDREADTQNVAPVKSSNDLAWRSFERPIWQTYQTTNSVRSLSVRLDIATTELERKKNLVRYGAFFVAGLLWLILAGLVWLWSKGLLGNLAAVSHTVQTLGDGDLNARCAESGPLEVVHLQQQVNALARATFERQRRLTSTIERASSTLKQQRDEATSASTAKSRFLAIASHDLRQPMHALGLFCSALERRVSDVEQKKLIHNIQTSLAAMRELFESLLDLSRLDAGRVQANINRVSLDELFTLIELEYGAAARDKGLRFRVRSSGVWCQADMTLLRRILMNLVSNAIRYTDRGGILIGVRQRGELLRIEVCDTGRGIDEKNQAAIFDEFTQISDTQRDKTKSLGLGLAIAQRNAQLLGTQISLRSRLNKGSIFSLNLLRAPNINDLTAERRNHEVHIILGLHVLVIEADAASRYGTVELLEQWGAEVRSSANLTEADRVLNDVWQPEVMVCDFDQKNTETIFSMVSRVETKTKRQCRVIIITNEANILSQTQLLNSHWLILNKPVPAAQLRLTIISAMQGASSQNLTAL